MTFLHPGPEVREEALFYKWTNNIESCAIERKDQDWTQIERWLCGPRGPCGFRGLCRLAGSGCHEVVSSAITLGVEFAKDRIGEPLRGRFAAKVARVIDWIG